MIDRSCDWFIPMAPPIMALIVATIDRSVLFKAIFIKKHSRNRGAIFCQVARRRQFVHEIEFITGGNQKWQGAAPSFSSNLNINMVAAREDGR